MSKDSDGDEDVEYEDIDDSDKPPPAKKSNNDNTNIINYANEANLSITSVTSGDLSSSSIQNLMRISTSPSIPTSSANKISLVPTNLLLKPQAQNITPTYKPPALVYTSQPNTTLLNQSKTSSIPMKVVFVNALNGQKINPQTNTLKTATFNGQTIGTSFNITTTQKPVQTQARILPMSSPCSLISGDSNSKPNTESSQQKSSCKFCFLLIQMNFFSHILNLQMQKPWIVCWRLKDEESNWNGKDSSMRNESATKYWAC